MAQDFEVVSQNDFLSLLSELIDVRKMLHGLIDRVSGKTNPAGKLEVSAKRKALSD